MRAVKVAIVVPTYNERDNIGSLLEALLGQGARSEHDLHIVVCDDTSPDGTSDAVASVRLRHPNVHLCAGEKLGLGAAYARGMRMAMAELGADAVLQMDADFSHDPAAIGDFLEAAKDADLVLGSRYLHGGVTVVNWPLPRLILSYCANLYTRIITGMPVHDATGGYKCFRRRALEGIRLDRVQSDGYAFQIEVSFKVWKRGFRIREIPIVFVDRRAGVSKMSRRIIWEAAGLVWRLRLLDLLGRADHGS